MKMKKAFAALMAATMVVSYGTTALAAGSGSAAPAASSSSAGSVSEEAVYFESTGASENSSASSGGGSSASAAVIATVKSAGTAINVAGSSVKTSIAGAYAAKEVQGVAVIDSLDTVKANLGLTSGQTPYVMVFDTNAKRSPMAMDCVYAAVEALGGEVVAALNIDLGAKEKGKFITLSNGSAAVVVGLPKGADTSKTASVICVRPGGKTSVLEDKDANPNTVTFEVEAGLGTYAIVLK